MNTVITINKQDTIEWLNNENAAEMAEQYREALEKQLNEWHADVVVEFGNTGADGVRISTDKDEGDIRNSYDAACDKLSNFDWID